MKHIKSNTDLQEFFSSRINPDRLRGGLSKDAPITWDKFNYDLFVATGKRAVGTSIYRYTRAARAKAPVDAVIAALNALGYSLMIVEKDDASDSH